MIWALQHSAKMPKSGNGIRNGSYAENMRRLLEITINGSYNYFEKRRELCEEAFNIIHFPSKIVNILTYKCV